MTGDAQPRGDARIGPDPATSALETLGMIGARVDGWAALDAVGGAGGAAPLEDPAFGLTSLAALSDVEDDALFVSLGVEAVVDTNAMVRQQSLRDFLS